MLWELIQKTIEAGNKSNDPTIKAGLETFIKTVEPAPIENVQE